MKRITLFTLFIFCLIIEGHSQVHHNVIDNPVSNSAERIAKFSVSDASRDFLEIVNGTQYNNQFVPNIWAHRESDNRIAFNIFSSIKSTVDNGTLPIFTFRAELRNSVYDNTTYPWGSSVTQVQNRPLFSWANYNSTKMLMKANGYLGLGTTNPTAQFHSTGTLRFQNLPNATTPTYLLGTDASGNVKEYSASSVGGSDIDWLKTTGGTPTSINDYIYTNGRVGIGVSSPSAQLHTTSTVRFQNLPNGTAPTYLLGTDSSGNVREYSPNNGGVALDRCLLPRGQTQTNFLTKITLTGDLTCSQVFDNGQNVGVGTVTPDEKLTVNGIVKANGAIFISDKKFKTEINKIQNSLSLVTKLDGKTYYWKANEFKSKGFSNKKQSGFIAQEVERIIPEIVHQSKNGEKGIDYIALIPYLVESIKEQQNQITILQNKLSEFEPISLKNENSIDNLRTGFSTNYPNPFSTSTMVDYYILKKVNTAKIIIYDTNGTTITTYQLKERGVKSQLTINKNKLKIGIYFYTMIADDIVVGTKKMIVQ